jgi:hypothetical protein
VPARPGTIVVPDTTCEESEESTVASDPEELLRSIERTREELANTVDTIAGRLDPKRAAKRSIGAVRESVTSVVDGARAKMHLAADGVAAHTPHGTNGHGTTTAGVGSTPGETAATAISARLAKAAPMVRRVPKPAVGVAALVAFAAIVASRRRRR